MLGHSWWLFNDRISEAAQYVGEILVRLIAVNRLVEGQIICDRLHASDLLLRQLRTLIQLT